MARHLVSFIAVVLLSLFVTGCVTDALRALLGGARFANDEPERMDEPIAEAMPPDARAQVTWRHLRCCYDLCKRQEPASVYKEPLTPYIICECKTGKRFRVTKLENKR